MKEYHIVGPPGCGKTTWLSRQVHRAVEQDGPESVLVSSLTRTAAAEVAGRRLPIPHSAVGTLHAHAYRALGRPPMALDKDALQAWNKERPRWALSIDGHRPDDDKEDGEGRTEADLCLEEIDRFRARRAPVNAWFSHLPVKDFYREWSDWKAEKGLLDFTDLIDQALALVEYAPGDPKYIFLDEAQDMSLIEMDLARAWAGQADQFVVVADPDQCLYEWRGSDPSVFYSGDPVWTRVLSQSYRVPLAVHREAVAWIERTPGRQPVEYKPRDYEGEVIRRPEWHFEDTSALVDDVCTHLDAGKTVMVLAACNYMLGKAVIPALRSGGVPFHNPYRRRQGAWNPLGAKHGAKDRLLSYLRFDGDVWGEEARNWTPYDLHDWLAVCEAKGLLRRGAKAQIGQLAESPAAGEPLPPETLLRWFEDGVLDELMSEPWQPQSLQWFARRLLASKASPFAFPLAVSQRYGAARLRETPRLIVGTVHSVKGAEADVVYLYPDLSYQGFANWHQGGQAEEAAIRRQFYVGMTRARETLVLCGPKPMRRGGRRVAQAVDWDG